MENYETADRCGFAIDEKRRKIWAVELTMLERFISICEKHGLAYYAIGGTLLGAVRHQGFIPWDDDIDIGMMRKDYDAFLLIAPQELKAPFCLQTTENEPWCYRPHAQIRNNSTTGYMKTEENLICSKGIFIDIFPLDGVADNRKNYQKQMRRMKIMNRIFMNYFFFDVMHDKKPVVKAAAHQLVKMYFAMFGHKNVYRRFDRLAAKYSADQTEYIGELTILFDNEKYQWEKAWFADRKTLPFEHLKVSVPGEYEKVLSRTFGNYMEYPEDKENSSLHGGMIFEPEIPYLTYLNKRSD